MNEPTDNLLPWMRDHAIPPIFAETLAADVGRLTRERDEARALLRDVATSGVDVGSDDARIGYVTVQVDRGTWNEVRSLYYPPPGATACRNA